MTETTEQVVVKKVPNPTGKGGFQDHPELRSPGGWKKETSTSYWINAFQRMSREEFEDFPKEKGKKNMTMAQLAAWSAVSKMNDLGWFKEALNRTEGMPVQKNEHSGPDGGAINIFHGIPPTSEPEDEE